MQENAYCQEGFYFYWDAGYKSKSKDYQAQSREIEVMHTRYGTLIHTFSALFSIFNALEGLSTIVFVAKDWNPWMFGLVVTQCKKCMHVMWHNSVYDPLFLSNIKGFEQVETTRLTQDYFWQHISLATNARQNNVSMTLIRARFT